MEHLPTAPGSPRIELKAKDCNKFDNCSAPICPMDEQSMKFSVFMADEEVCSNETYRHLPWVTRQRKIAKVVRDHDTIYTYRMLQRECVMGRAMTGIDPDNEYETLKQEENEWLARHPTKRILTDEERKVRSSRLPKPPMGSSPFSEGQSAADKEG